jgi:hypothetical protein
MQQHRDGASVDMAMLNQAYQESRNCSTLEGKEAADQTVFACQDQLRQQRMKFHLAPRGEWVLDHPPIPSFMSWD